VWCTQHVGSTEQECPVICLAESSDWFVIGPLILQIGGKSVIGGKLAGNNSTIAWLLKNGNFYATGVITILPAAMLVIHI